MDQQLRQLIQEVLACQNGSSEQRQAMNRLLNLIPQLPRIYKHLDTNINYPEVFNQALMGISLDKGGVSDIPLRNFIQKRNLDINNTHQEIIVHFVRWFNKILNFKIIDAYRSLKNKPLSLDNSLSDENNGTYLDLVESETFTNIDDIIKKEQEQRIQRIGQNMWRYIEEDPEGKLQNCHPRNYPNANCQELARRLYLKEPPDKLASIAREINVSYQTLNSHFKRNCLEFFREIGKNLGYIQEQSK
jgi:hypothetical protein